MKGVIKKFRVRRSCTWLLVVFAIIGIFFCAWCSYNINANMKLSSHDIAIYSTLKDVFTVLISVCGVNLLFSIVIEVESKNELVTDVILNDVIASPQFYCRMDREKQEAMHNALETVLFSGNQVKQEIYRDVREKLCEDTGDYYYEECSYSVTCAIHDSYIEKKISSSVILRSFKEDITIENFVLLNCSSKKIENLESHNISKIEIDGNILSKDDYRKTDVKIGELARQNDYNSAVEYVYNKPLLVPKDRGVKISMHYIVRTNIDDISSTFRVSRPCKNYSLIFNIKDNQKHRLVCNAFGFWDNAESSTNNQDQSNVSIKFSDWIFKYDGATVIILEK